MKPFRSIIRYLNDIPMLIKNFEIYFTESLFEPIFLRLTALRKKMFVIAKKKVKPNCC